MAEIKESEKLILEKIFKMEGGYVLELSNSKLQQFIHNNLNIDIYSEKYIIYGDSKAKRIRAFWHLENNQIVGKFVIELLDYWKTEKILKGKSITDNENLLHTESLKIGNRLLGKANNPKDFIENIDSFLNKDFENVSLERLNLDSSTIGILDSRIQEIKKAIQYKSALSCVILSGSVLEGILLGFASSKMKEYNQCDISPKNRETQKVLPYNQWSLSNFIDVSHKLGYLGLDVKKYSHSLRDFRNYIHPYEQMVSKFNPDIETAKISWQVLKAAITDLSKNS
jgi:hypothetical protein